MYSVDSVEIQQDAAFHLGLQCLQQEAPWALDRSPVTLQGGEDVYHKL